MGAGVLRLVRYAGPEFHGPVAGVAAEFVDLGRGAHLNRPFFVPEDFPASTSTITPGPSSDSTPGRSLCGGLGKRQRALSKTAFWASDMIRFGLTRHIRIASCAFSSGTAVILTSCTRLPVLE